MPLCSTLHLFPPTHSSSLPPSLFSQAKRMVLMPTLRLSTYLFQRHQRSELRLPNLCIIMLSVRTTLFYVWTALTAYLAIKLLGSAFETDSSVTEPETDMPDEFASNVDTSDHSNNNSDDEGQGNPQGNAIVALTRKPRTARKQQFDKVSITSVYCASRLPTFTQQPRWSQEPLANTSPSKVGSHAIVRNCIIEIPDDETSPTPQGPAGNATYNTMDDPLLIV